MSLDDVNAFPLVNESVVSYEHVTNGFNIWILNQTSNMSSSTNATSPNVADAVWNKDVRIIVLWIQIVLGFIGGLAVFVWLWVNRKRKSRLNIIMLHVTLSDLLVIVATLIQVIWEMLDRWWLAGDAMCRIIKFYQGFVMMASSNMLVMLSVDRHQAIRSPLRNPIPVWKLCLPFWLAAALLSIPMFFLFYTNTNKDPNSFFHNKTVCESVFRHRPLIHRQVFLTSMSIFHLFLPCTVIAICYIRIFLKISQKSYEADTSNVVKKPGKIQLQSTGSSSLHKAKIKTLKMTVVIVTVFILCGLPYHILEMMYNYWSHIKVHEVVAGVLGALPVANSVVNPYIFLAFSVQRRPKRGKYSDTQNNSQCTTKTTLNVRYTEYKSTEIELTNITRKA